MSHNIQRSGRTNDVFAEELKKRLPTVKAEEAAGAPDELEEKKLAEDRDKKGQEAVTEGTHEVQLDSDRKGPEEPALYEKLLNDHRDTKTSQAITEARLNDAPAGGLYPHRNPKAHERTGDKRPINALPEELGSASDKAKRERYEKAAKGGEKREVDEDVGSQMTNDKTTIKASKTAGFYDSQLASGNVNPEEEANKFIYGPMANADEISIRRQLGQRFQDQNFVNTVIKMVEQGRGMKQPVQAFNLNMKKVAQAEQFRDYISYKNAMEPGVKMAAQQKFAEVKELDAMMSSIMETAQASNRALNDDERAQIAAMKIRKSSLLLK